MKRIRILSLLIILAGLLYSCYDDKGNYDYDWVPEVTLTPKAGGFRDTTIRSGQHLTIVPELKSLLKIEDGVYDSVKFNADNYIYQWVAYLDNLNTPGVVLAETRNLDTTVYLPLKTYRVIYYVTDKEHGVTYDFNFSMKVETRFKEAWLFLTEDDNQMVDMTLYGKELGNTNENPWIYEYNVLERSGFPYRGKGAKFVYYHTGKTRIFVGTGEGCGWLGKANLDWSDKQMVNYKMASPQGLNYTFENIAGTGGKVWHFIATDGSVYPMMGADDILLSAYSILPPSLSGSGLYDTVRFAPFVATSSKNCLVYNTTDKKMMCYEVFSGAPAYSSLKNLSAADRLDDHEVFYMDSYDNTSKTQVIAKNNQDGKYYKYIFTQSNKTKTQTDEIVNGALLEEGEHFVCDYKTGFFYMSRGNQIYVFRDGQLQPVTITDPDQVMEEGFDGTLDDIVTLTRDVNKSQIIISTYQDGVENSGKVYFLKSTSVEARVLTLVSYNQDLGRVKSVSRFY